MENNNPIARYHGYHSEKKETPATAMRVIQTLLSKQNKSEINNWDESTSHENETGGGPDHNYSH